MNLMTRTEEGFFLMFSLWEHIFLKIMVRAKKGFFSPEATKFESSQKSFRRKAISCKILILSVVLSAQSYFCVAAISSKEVC
jgi:hypothetical protein